MNHELCICHNMVIKLSYHEPFIAQFMNSDDEISIALQDLFLIDMVC